MDKSTISFQQKPLESKKPNRMFSGYEVYERLNSLMKGRINFN